MMLRYFEARHVTIAAFAAILAHIGLCVIAFGLAETSFNANKQAQLSSDAGIFFATLE